MKILKEYESQSGKMINKDKSYFDMFNKAGYALIKEVEEAIGFLSGKFPLIYLGCPISHSKMKKTHFNELIKKIQNKM